MFERFPTLKRLERLLSRAQAFSPKKAKRSTPRRDLADSPILAHSRRSKKNSKAKKSSRKKHAKKNACEDQVETPSDVGQRPPPGKRVPISRVHHLVDSDNVLNRGKPLIRPINVMKPVHVHQETGESADRNRTWSASQRSPREILRSRGRSPVSMMKLDKSPLNDRHNHVPLVKTIGRKVFHRKMQEAPPSDALNVLSEEESEEQFDNDQQKPVRYPLPTMPLSIMVPVSNIPDYVVPVDLETVTKKVSRFDLNIATLMESRKKLASSYSLFDDLCCSFRGPENLDRFLRSLMTNKPMPELHSLTTPNKNKCSEHLHSAADKPEDPHDRVLHPVISEDCIGEDASPNEANLTRLCRPTVSTMMKRVEAVRNRPKHVMAHEVTTDSNVKTRHRPSAANRQLLYGKRLRKRMNKNMDPAPISEEDARAEMLHRVRRGLMNLPWAVKPRRSSASRSSVRLSQESL